jgi:aspartate ammonia-lyase
VGNSINVSPKYIKALYIELSKLAKLNLRPGKNLMAMTSSTTDLLAFSHSLLAACVDLSKIANDLRLLSSGPQGGVGEISLPELQAGSSIMPGKVNPVLPEAVNQMYFLVSGNTVTIEHASQAAQLQLNVMLPVMTDRLIESIRLMNELIPQFAQSCVAGIKVNKKQCKENLERSTAYATLLSPKLGYDAVSSAVKEAVRKNKTIRQVVLEKKMVTNAEFDKLVSAFLGNNL